MSNAPARPFGIGRLVISGLVFEVVWLLCVLAPGTAQLAGLTLGNLALHLWLFHGRPADIDGAKRTLCWVAWVTSLGCWVDAALFRAGVFSTSHDIVLLPSWLFFLWINFALALRFAFVFLQRSLVLAAVIGAVAGPCSYWIGAKINGAVTLDDPVPFTFLLLACVWSALLPLLVVSARVRFFRH